MNRRSLLRLCWILAFGLFLGLGTAHAQDATARIRARLPEIDALKAAGVVGESNVGLLSARTVVNDAQKKLIAAENADRTELYGIVARRSGQTVEEVGQQRAVRIAQQALSGVWLQTAQGEWYQKP